MDPFPLGPCITDVEHPLTHLDSLRELHHLSWIWVDDVLEDLLLGGAGSGHGELDLTKNNKANKT